MAKSATHEILSTRFWDFIPEALHGYKKKLDDNMAFRIPFVKDEQREDCPYFLSSKTGFNERTYIGISDGIDFDKFEPDDNIINVIDIRGVILRNGDACSYGSKEHRDIIKRAADDSHTLGHLILMDSPGGSSYSKYDYEDAINYAKSKGQPVIGLINGMACSAGYAPIAMCTESYVVGLHDSIGCIGTLFATYLSKHGDINSITQQQYVELYASGSPYKNKEVRDAAEGIYDELQKDVDRMCEDFQNTVKKYRPQVTDEQLKGRTYDSAEVIGTMIDGQGTIESCIARILELSDSQGAPFKVEAPEGKDSDSKQPAGAGDNASSATSDSNNQHSINKENMKEYPKIMSALGLNALASDKNGGLYLHQDLADALTTYIEHAETVDATLAAKLTEVSQLNATIDQLKKDHAQTVESLTSSHATELSNLTAAHKTTVDSLNEDLKNAKDLIVAKEAEIKELSETTQDPPKPADGAPKGNGSDGKQEEGFSVSSVCKEDMTLEQKVKANKERMDELKKRAR